MRTRKTIIFILLGVAAVILFVIDMATGAVPIPLNQVVAAIAGGDCPEMTARIVINIRLVKAVVARLAGAALSVSGLEMQTLFRNPLAGPYVLGISSGASLGVALFILGAPLAGLSGYVDSIGIVGAAWIGASAVLAVIAFVGRRITDIMVILILGIMFSSGVSAIVQVLQYLSHEDALKSFVIWTMGSLGEVTISQLIVAVPAVIAGLVLAVAAVKPLNLLLLGEDYGRCIVLNPLRSRALLFMSTTLLAGTVTAFCGPIGFIGMALPHVARMLFSDADHRVLIPACMLVGADVMLACDIISKFFTVPVNAITALFGIPIVVWVVVKNKPVTA